jgi:uncharacterized protein
MSIPVIDVRDLVGHPGATRAEDVVGTLSGLASELVRVPDDAPIRAELLLEAIVEGLVVSGTITGTWEWRCARCLTPGSAPFRAQVHELFTTGDGDDETYGLDPDAGLDPSQMTRDAIGVEMPFAPLCRPDCLGLCATCGGNRNLGECPGHQQVDPRFAVLSELLPDLDT